MSARAQSACVALIVGVLIFDAWDRKRRVGPPPPSARVIVNGDEMVPLPYADYFIEGGRPMSLAEAEREGAHRVISADIDWSYITRESFLRLGTREAAWSVEWAEPDYEPDRWP